MYPSGTLVLLLDDEHVKLWPTLNYAGFVS